MWFNIIFGKGFKHEFNYHAVVAQAKVLELYELLTYDIKLDISCFWPACSNPAFDCVTWGICSADKFVYLNLKNLLQHHETGDRVNFL